jgi:ferredoxin--NADP+ reductase
MAYTEQIVTSTNKWSNKTFSFTTTRSSDFQFENGEFVTLGLRPEGKLIARAYSIVSTNDADHLEFLSIHVPNGPLTSRLVNVREGDGIWINSKSTGTLTLRNLQPGRNLYHLATGTGLAPFMSLIRDPQTYLRHENVILVHTVRTRHELAYRAQIEALASDALHYVPTVTREPFDPSGRGADLFRSGDLFARLGLAKADPQLDRVMLCGNPQMIREMTGYLETGGWVLSSYKGVGTFTVEKAFTLHHND